MICLFDQYIQVVHIKNHKTDCFKRPLILLAVDLYTGIWCATLKHGATPWNMVWCKALISQGAFEKGLERKSTLSLDGLTLIRFNFGNIKLTVETEAKSDG